VRTTIPALFPFFLPDLTDCCRRVFWAAHDRPVAVRISDQVWTSTSPNGIGTTSQARGFGPASFLSGPPRANAGRPDSFSEAGPHFGAHGPNPHQAAFLSHGGASDKRGPIEYPRHPDSCRISIGNFQYLATAANAFDRAVKRRVLAIDWIVRIIHQVLLRGT
jgi:hypothetical protein